MKDSSSLSLILKSLSVDWKKACLILFGCAALTLAGCSSERTTSGALGKDSMQGDEKAQSSDHDDDDSEDDDDCNDQSNRSDDDDCEDASGGGGTLVVTSPNGGEAYAHKQWVTITWDKGNAGSQVRIAVLRNGDFYRWIKRTTQNDGKHRWRIPKKFPAGDDYSIQITSRSDSGIADASDASFSIATGSVTVTSPNGGESFAQHQRVTITWEQGDAGPKVRISLLRNGEHYRWIKRTTKNDGRHSWKIPKKIAVGDGYAIKVTSRTASTNFDISDGTFSVTKRPSSSDDEDSSDSSDGS